MPQTILISARPQDRAAAALLQEQLSAYQENVRFVPDDPEAAADIVAAADALMLIITADWQPDSPVMNRTIQAGLQRSDLLTIAVCIDEALIPAAAGLPEDLQGLAYTPTASLRTERAEFDARQINEQISSYLDSTTPQSRRRTPWNLILIVTILAVALVMILIQQVTRSDDTESTFEASPVTVVVSPDANVVIGLGAGLSDRSAERGQEMLNGVQLALDERPAVQLGEHSFLIDLLAQDTGCSTIGGQRVAERFTADPDVVGVIGHLCETSCRSAATIYDAADYVTISPGCSAPGLTVDLSDSFNRTVPSQTNVAQTTAQFILNDLDIQQVAVIRDEQIFSGQLADEFRRAFTSRGGEISNTYQIESLTFTEEAFVDDLLADELPSALYYAGRALNAAKIRAELRARGITDLPLILGDGSTADDYAERVGTEATGETYTLQTLPPSGEGVTTLAERYTDTYGSAPESSLFAYAYDATNMLLDSIEGVAVVNENGELVIDRVELMGFVRSYFGDGVTGLLSCNGRGDCGEAEATTLILQDGEWLSFDS